jgi:predicted nucleic acid-binding protein
MKVLFDTCLIIDYLQNRLPFAEEEEPLIEAVARGEIEGFITAKSLTDIYYLTHHVLHDENKTQNVIAELLKIFHLADTTASDCLDALALQSKDYEDAVMSETAKRLKIPYLLTRNVPDFPLEAGVNVLTPNAFKKIAR